MENAIRNYRIIESNETFDEPTNTAVESVQEFVSVETELKWKNFQPPPSLFFLFSPSLPNFLFPCHFSLPASLPPSISLQFECCGVTNYTDWKRLNPDAVEMNNNLIPARCYCDVNEENCLNDEKYDTTNVWDRVREYTH